MLAFVFKVRIKLIIGGNTIELLYSTLEATIIAYKYTLLSKV